MVEKVKKEDDFDERDSFDDDDMDTKSVRSKKSLGA